MNDTGSATPSSVVEYAAAIENLSGGQFTGRFTEEGRKFFASLYGAPFFALSVLAPELRNIQGISLLIADSFGSFAADGGRWLSLYAKAGLLGKISCTVCVNARPRAIKAPKPLLFQSPQQILVKSWSRHMADLDAPPDCLILYIPDGFDAIKAAIEELGRLRFAGRTLLACHSYVEALIVQSLIGLYGFTSSAVIGFNETEEESQHFAIGTWWFSAAASMQQQQPTGEEMEPLQNAYAFFRKFIRSRDRDEARNIVALYATCTDERVGDEQIRAIWVSPEGGIDLNSGRYFLAEEVETEGEKCLVWKDKALNADMLATVPDTADRLALVIWLAKALIEEYECRKDDSVGQSQQVAEDEPKLSTPAPVAGDDSVSVGVEPVVSSASGPASVPSEQPLRPPRSRLSRSAGTVNVLALAARLGKPGQQSDKAFETARSKIVSWLRSKGFRVTDPSSNSHIELPEGEAIIETDGQSVWALRFDDRRSMEAGAIWRVEATLLGKDSPALSIRLAQVRSTEDAPPPVASGVPSMVAAIAKDVGLQDAGVPLRNAVVRLTAEKGAMALSALLLNSYRSQPVIVVSSTDSASKPDASVDRLAARLAGVAHVVCIDGAVSERLIRSFGRERSVYGNAIRLYRPGFSGEADQYQHPVWALKGGQLPKWVANDLFEEACAISLDVGELEERAPSFQMVRNHLAEQRLASSEQRLAALRLQAENIASSKDEQIGQLQAIRAELESAMAGYKAKTTELEALANQLRDELQATRRERDTALEEARQLRYQRDNQWAQEDAPATEPADESYYPETWDELETWVEVYGEDKLVLHPKAAKAARESPFKDVPLAYKAMEYLVRYYIPMRTRSVDDHEAYQRSRQALAELGLEESDVGTADEIKRYKKEYQRQYGDKVVTLDRHLKRGVGFGGDYQFRLYFYYDDEATKVLVGHMPTHLTNRLTHNG